MAQYKILHTCKRYEGINYNAKHELITDKAIGRTGNILLDVKHLNFGTTDLAFYPDEVEEIKED